MVLFFSIATALWGAFHAYVVLRLLAPLKLGLTARSLAYVVCGALVPLGPAAFFVDELLAAPYDAVFRWIAWTYMGAFSVLLALMLVRDLLLGGLWLWQRSRGPHARFAPESRERRQFLMATSGGVLGATGLLTTVGVRQARQGPEVVEVEVPITGLPKELDGYHIVQISDVHVGETIDKDFILPIVEQVTSLSPDLVAVTGDVVDGSVEGLRADVSPLAYLRAKDHVLFVTGNHEYYSGVEAWCAHFRELGMTVLNNSHVLVERGGKKLLIAGVTDRREGSRHPGHRSDPKQALAGAPPHDVRILLAHQPRSAFEACRHGFALQLSGHTHGGQFFPWNFVVDYIQKPVVRGLGRHEGMWVYVNRGTCYWGPPLRTFVPAEITSLRLRTA